MAKKPDTPCAGGCGKLLWGGSTSLPAGQRMCQPCRRGRSGPSPEHRPMSGRTCATCSQTFDASGTTQLYCSPKCKPKKSGGPSRYRPTDQLSSEQKGRRRAHWRRKNHHRRALLRTADVTAEWERGLRAKAKRCPLCGQRLTEKPGRPNSKHLDHIVPICVGGTHTVGNVRVICRDCNLRRPSDGSDYVGPVTLWAQDQAVAESISVALWHSANPPSECDTCGGPLRDYRCWTCRPSRRRTLTRSPDADRLAAEMREAGHGWQAIADGLGYGSAGSAYLGAQKWVLSGVTAGD